MFRAMLIVLRNDAEGKGFADSSGSRDERDARRRLGSVAFRSAKGRHFAERKATLLQERAEAEANFARVGRAHDGGAGFVEQAALQIGLQLAYKTFDRFAN